MTTADRPAAATAATTAQRRTRAASVEYIEDRARRDSAFRKRVWGFMRKGLELSTICGCAVAIAIVPTERPETVSAARTAAASAAAKGGPPAVNSGEIIECFSHDPQTFAQLYNAAPTLRGNRIVGLDHLDRHMPKSQIRTSRARRPAAPRPAAKRARTAEARAPQASSATEPGSADMLAAASDIDELIEAFNSASDEWESAAWMDGFDSSSGGGGDGV